MVNGWTLHVIINAKHFAHCQAPNDHPILVSYCCLIAIVDIDEGSRMVGIWYIVLSIDYCYSFLIKVIFKYLTTLA